jgi:hypothetical protein
MKNVGAMAVTVIAALGIAVSAFAELNQGDKSERRPDAVPRPVLSAEGRQFVESFVGKWRGEDAVFMMGDQQVAQKVALDCERVSAGWGAVCKLKVTGRNAPVQESTMLLGWDLARGEAHLFEVSNTADVHNHVGNWSNNGRTISLAHQGIGAEGGDERDLLTFTWTSPRELVVRGEGSLGNATVWTLAGTLRK